MTKLEQLRGRQGWGGRGVSEDHRSVKDFSLAEMMKMLGLGSKARADYGRLCSERDAALARAEKAEALLAKWVDAYDRCGGDNGPSLTEDDCANEARALLAKGQGGEEG